MRKRARLCVVSPTYIKEPKNTASPVKDTAVKAKKISFFRFALYIVPFILSAILFMTGFIGFGFNVFLDNVCAGVIPISYTDNMVKSLLLSPPKSEIKLYPRFVLKKNYTSEKELCQKLMLIDGQAFEGSAFICDGKPLFVLENQSEVQSVIAEYTEPYKTENTTITVLDCVSETVNGVYEISEKTGRADALAALAGMDVITVESVNTTEIVARVTETTMDSSKKSGTVTVTCEGSDGEMEVTKVIRKVNGSVTYEKVVEQTMLTIPVSRIETHGTKVVTGTGTGTFKRPVFGAVSSNFGPRWGKNHNGTDFLGNVGDPVEAADEGTVSFTGTAEGYGNLIIIDHKNGYETYYGHLNKSYVSEGDKIEAGEVIGEIGSTGNSTGPHLHFEIRKDGVPVNPINYVN